MKPCRWDRLFELRGDVRMLLGPVFYHYAFSSFTRSDKRDAAFRPVVWTGTPQCLEGGRGFVTL